MAADGNKNVVRHRTCGRDLGALEADGAGRRTMPSPILISLGRIPASDRLVATIA